MKAKKNQKNHRTQKTAKQPAGRSKAITAVLVILIIIVIAYLLIPGDSDKWIVNSEGILSYPENRGKVDVTVIKTESGSNYTLETISFPSKDYTVEGLLRVPSSEKKVPAVVLLPGATVPKEGTQGLAQILSGMGFASLGIEQRNRGGVDPRYD
ncbi:MAG: alpha/beta hydrolase, partial [Methanosarcinales archaeon]